jgi:hypothetical protein
LRIDAARLVEYEIEQLLDGAINVLRHQRGVVKEGTLIAKGVQFCAQLLAESVERISFGARHDHLLIEPTREDRNKEGLNVSCEQRAGT